LDSLWSMGRLPNDARGRFARGIAINPATLRQARLGARMTLEQASRGIVTRQAFHQFEHGLARPMPDKLEAIAARLGVPSDTLLARPRDPREVSMRELEQEQRWYELERLATTVLADLN